MRKLGPFVVLAALFALAASAACTTEEGSTPDCQNDLANGYPDRNVDGGCNGFAGCYVNGVAAPPQECCKDLMGEALQLCLYGYGAADPPMGTATSGGGMGGGTTTATTTSGGGMGGSGGAANGGGGSGG